MSTRNESVRDRWFSDYHNSSVWPKKPYNDEDLKRAFDFAWAMGRDIQLHQITRLLQKATEND